MRKKLLLAEDSVTMQKVFELAFAQSDVSVIAVDNGHDAIRLVEEIGPDLVVADVTLPGVDGYGVASAIRDLEAGKHIPILILSGTMVPIDEERLKACGAKGVLIKPFECRELLEKVEGLVGEAAEAPAAANPPEPPPRDEHWDFSDVLDEAEGVVPAGRAEDPARERDAMLPGGLLPVAPKDEPVALNEYDVSIEEIEEPVAHAPAHAPEPASEQPEPASEHTEEIPVRAAHIEGSIQEDAPPAVTDLLPAVEEAEEMEEIEDIQEIQEIEEVSQEPAATAETAPGDIPLPVASPDNPLPAEEVAALQAALKEQFAARADVIFRAVATEAVEKAMWELMDRLTAEFSEKVRESVDAVAWEVIPATAETLIREEIARIRALVEKPSN
jgi:CheY-like chemotaxis protein